MSGTNEPSATISANWPRWPGPMDRVTTIPVAPGRTLEMLLAARTRVVERPTSPATRSLVDRVTARIWLMRRRNRPVRQRPKAFFAIRQTG